jgi:hypothetical protein
LRFGEEAIDAPALGEVEGDAVTLADLVDAFEPILQVLLVAAASEDFDTVARQQDADRPADAGGSAGDHRLAPFQGGHSGVGIGNVRIGFGHGASP